MKEAFYFKKGRGFTKGSKQQKREKEEEKTRGRRKRTKATLGPQPPREGYNQSPHSNSCEGPRPLNLHTLYKGQPKSRSHPWLFCIPGTKAWHSSQRPFYSAPTKETNKLPPGWATKSYFRERTKPCISKLQGETLHSSGEPTESRSPWEFQTKPPRRRDNAREYDPHIPHLPYKGNKKWWEWSIFSEVHQLWISWQEKLPIWKTRFLDEPGNNIFRREGHLRVGRIPKEKDTRSHTVNSIKTAQPMLPILLILSHHSGIKTIEQRSNIWHFPIEHWVP